MPTEGPQCPLLAEGGTRSFKWRAHFDGGLLNLEVMCKTCVGGCVVCVSVVCELYVCVVGVGVF